MSIGLFFTSLLINHDKCNGRIHDERYVRMESTIKEIKDKITNNEKLIPKYKKNKNVSWDLSYKTVIDILNDLSRNKNLKILIKKKSNATQKKNE